MIAPLAIPVTGPAATRAAALAAQVPALDTPRTRLRAPHLTDFDALQSIMGAGRGIHAGGPATPAETWADFARATATWLLRGHGMWSVETRDDGRVAGFVLIGAEPGDLEHELGFLFTASGEGRGLAEEAATAARHHAWDALDLPSLVSYVATGNDRAERLMHRMGAMRDGILPGTGSMSGEDVTIWRHARPEATE